MDAGSASAAREFLASLAGIVLIDLVLAGDNAVVIAMAVRTLPPERRRWGVLLGAAAAVLLRVVLTFFVARLLLLGWVKLAGGLLVLWVAARLFVEGGPEGGGRRATTTWQAVRLIAVADATMSLDNMLAVGGASRGDPLLLLVGLGVSIPLVVLASNLVAALMDRYPVVVYAGAAVLGKVSAEMILTDPFVASLVHPGPLAVGLAEAACAAGIIVAGRLWARWAARQEAPPAGDPGRR